MTTSTFASKSRIAVALFAGLSLLGACGGDDDTAAPAMGADSENPTSVETGDSRSDSENPTSVETGDSRSDSENPTSVETGGDSRSDSESSSSDDSDVSPRMKTAANALRVSLLAEDAEVEGNTIHVYFKDRGGATDAGAECQTAAHLVPDGATVVIHKGGTETTC